MGPPSQQEIYVDNNATTQALPEVRAAVEAALGSRFGNPSSVHTAGDRGRALLREARLSLSNLIGSRPDDLIFTSGGTEANTLVLSQALRTNKPYRIVTTTVEHSSILKTCEFLQEQGTEIVLLNVDRDGQLDLDRLRAELQTPTDLVSIQWVNNETGVIQPVEQIAEICHEREVRFHTDAAQAVGKLPIDVTKIKIDFLTLTAHKIHGPPESARSTFAPRKRSAPRSLEATKNPVSAPAPKTSPASPAWAPPQNCVISDSTKSQTTSAPCVTNSNNNSSRNSRT